MIETNLDEFRRRVNMWERFSKFGQPIHMSSGDAVLIRTLIDEVETLRAIVADTSQVEVVEVTAPPKPPQRKPTPRKRSNGH